MHNTELNNNKTKEILIRLAKWNSKYFLRLRQLKHKRFNVKWNNLKENKTKENSQ